MRPSRRTGNNSFVASVIQEGVVMKVSFLISVPAFHRLGSAAGERGWRSDPEYAQRIVEQVLERGPAAAREIEGRQLGELAAMSGEFESSALDDIVRNIGRFFGERPPRVAVQGVEYAVGPTLAALSPMPA
jgi:hypothetical protein